jgi:hypothetical protein
MQPTNTLYKNGHCFADLICNTSQRDSVDDWAVPDRPPECEMSAPSHRQPGLSHGTSRTHLSIVRAASRPLELAAAGWMVDLTNRR